mgnify:CR=1 FL=1
MGARRDRRPLAEQPPDGGQRGADAQIVGDLAVDDGDVEVGPQEDRPALEPWAEHWYLWVSAAFLRGYLEAAAGAAFLPTEGDEVESLLTVYLLGKAIYELGYELNNRPEWVRIPLEGILHLIKT